MTDKRLAIPEDLSDGKKLLDGWKKAIKNWQDSVISTLLTMTGQLIDADKETSIEELLSNKVAEINLEKLKKLEKHFRECEE